MLICKGHSIKYSGMKFFRLKLKFSLKKFPIQPKFRLFLDIDTFCLSYFFSSKYFCLLIKFQSNLTLYGVFTVLGGVITVLDLFYFIRKRFGTQTALRAPNYPRSLANFSFFHHQPRSCLNILNFTRLYIPLCLFKKKFHPEMIIILLQEEFLLFESTFPPF